MHMHRLGDTWGESSLPASMDTEIIEEPAQRQ